MLASRTHESYSVFTATRSNARRAVLASLIVVVAFPVSSAQAEMEGAAEGDKEEIEVPPIGDAPLPISEDEGEAPPLEDEPLLIQEDEGEAPPLDDDPLLLPDAPGGQKATEREPPIPSLGVTTADGRWGRWYGWQILLADSLLHVTLLVGLTSGSDALGLIGLGGGYFAGPTIHVAHGHSRRAVGSFALLIAPLLCGIAIERGSFDTRTVSAVAGATLLAEIVDIALLAWDPDDAVIAADGAQGAWGMWLRSARGGGALLGIGRRF